jgi:hypothetical protein
MRAPRHVQIVEESLKPSIDRFEDELIELMGEHGIGLDEVWNMDQIGV